jgi:hypothetical protein
MSLLKALHLPVPASLGGTPAAAVSAQKQKQLAAGAESWRRTHARASEQIAALKAAVKSHCADGHPALLAQIDKGLAKLDGVMENVDHRLAESMASAGAADDHGTHQAELKGARALLTEYINYVKSEPLVAHIDDNPFGVKTGLKALLVTGLSDAAKAIG